MINDRYKHLFGNYITMLYITSYVVLENENITKLTIDNSGT